MNPSVWAGRRRDKVRFWTENADMFGAPSTAVGYFDIVANRRTSGVRSGAYAHLRKLHGLSGELMVWPGIADVDTVSIDSKERGLEALLANHALDGGSGSALIEQDRLRIGSWSSVGQVSVIFGIRVQDFEWLDPPDFAGMGPPDFVPMGLDLNSISKVPNWCCSDPYRIDFIGSTPSPKSVLSALPHSSCCPVEIIVTKRNPQTDPDA